MITLDMALSRSPVPMIAGHINPFGDD